MMMTFFFVCSTYKYNTAVCFCYIIVCVVVVAKVDMKLDLYWNLPFSASGSHDFVLQQQTPRNRI